ncbi:MAG: hypothetical protein QM778_12440 [Myxococcales bacterium]
MNVGRVRLLLILGLMACEETDPDITRERGDLGRGKFIYECLGETDAACDDGRSAQFPQAIAVNSKFGMRFAIDSGSTPSVIPGASTFVQSVVGGYKALRAGELALLAVNGNREVIDIKHVRSAAVAEVRVQRGSALPEPDLELGTDQGVELRAVPFDSLGVPLAGALDYTWTSRDPAMVRVETLPELNRIRVRALRAGDTTLDVMVGDRQLSLEVHASGPTVHEDAGLSERDGGEDAGQEQDAGSDAGETDGGTT